MCSRIVQGCTAFVISMLPLIALADNGVLSTFMTPSGPAPIVSVNQGIGPNGVLRYEGLQEEVVEIPVTVYGACDVNFRLHRAEVEDFFQELDGTDVLVQAPPPDVFIQNFDVNTDAKKFGPREEILKVPRGFLQNFIVAEGESLVDEMADKTTFTEEELRETQITTLVHFRPTFYFACRRWAFGNTLHWQTSRAELQIQVNFLPSGMEPQGPDDGEPPGSGVAIPIPMAKFTAGTQIEQNSFQLTPDPTRGPCGYALTGTFVTNGPTTIRYRIEDHLGALSPEFMVEVGKTVAFVSHDIDFSDETGGPLGFTANEEAKPEAKSLLFGDTKIKINQPSDLIQGYFRVVTTEPHKSNSNIVSYNLHNCSSETLAPPAVFSAQIVTDPEGLRVLVRKHLERVKAGKDKSQAYPESNRNPNPD